MMKAYPAYKESGVAWLGEVPEHWDSIRTKHLFHERIEKGYPKEPLLAATQTKGVIPKTLYENRTVVAQKDLHLLKLVEIGDFVISLRSFQGGIEYAYYRGIISPAYTIMIPRKRIQSGYFKHLAKSKKFISLLQICVTGIREGQNINYEILKKTPLPIPPLPEQQQIARYLDWKTAKITKFIKAKKKLIALLNEQKQNVINEAVTKGINPDVKMKDSGVEWLGEVPEHWEVWRIGHFAKVGNGSTPSRSVTGYWEGGLIPWLNSSQVNRGKIDSADQFVTETALRECHLPMVSPHSLLIGITGQGKTRGLSAILEIKATINQHIAYISIRLPVITICFLHLILTALYPHLRRISDGSGSTKGALTCEDLKKFKISVPPLDEQRAIVNYIDKETAILENLISSAQKEIQLIQEYQTRLISDAVTGKIDVRSIKIPDFDPVEPDAEAPENDESEAELLAEEAK